MAVDPETEAPVERTFPVRFTTMSARDVPVTVSVNVTLALVGEDQSTAPSAGDLVSTPACALAGVDGRITTAAAASATAAVQRFLMLTGSFVDGHHGRRMFRLGLTTHGNLGPSD